MHDSSLAFRAFALAAADPDLVALRSEDSLFLAVRGAVLVREEDPRLALDALARGIESVRGGVAGELAAFLWLGYDAARADEPGSERDARPRGDLAPCAYLQGVSAFVRVALSDGRVSIGGRDLAAARALVDRLRAGPVLEELRAYSVESATDRGRHGAQVRAVREAILDGDVYLVNVARMLHVREGLDDRQVASRVARSMAPFSALLRAPGVTVGAMSMERALRWDRALDTFETRPIKGTRPRHADPAQDEALARELSASEKERAENVMAVDVHRNDLGRVSATGTVTVSSLCSVERHAYVHHLVSTVLARPRDGVTVREVLEAMLPMGSVTGAPKRAAMTLIAALEPERRGLYTGVYGALYGDSSLDLAVAIRTLVVDASGAHYGSGGGIVIDSDPDAEWAELAWKERALSGRAG